jgi:hypothetical protein
MFAHIEAAMNEYYSGADTHEHQDIKAHLAQEGGHDALRQQALHINALYEAKAQALRDAIAAFRSRQNDPPGINDLALSSDLDA